MRNSLNFRKLAVFFSILFYFPMSFSAEEQQINALMSFFGTGCSVNGLRTQGSYLTTMSLVNTLKSLQQDPDCKSAVSAVDTLQMIANSVTYSEKEYTDSERESLALENKKKELTYLLSIAASSSEISALSSELRNVKLDLALRQGQMEADINNGRRERRNEMWQNVMFSTRGVLNQIAANEACWSKNPNLIQQVAAFGNAIGSSVVLGVYSGGTSVAAGSGISLFASVIDYFYKKSQQVPISKLTQALESSALTCALEMMSNQYCAAKDAIDSVNLVAKALTQNQKTDPVWSSMRLIERELPNLTSWLEKVRAGAEPASVAIANDRKQIYNSEQVLKTTNDFTLGTIADADPQFRLSTTPQSQWIVQKDVVSKIVKLIYTSVYTSNGEGTTNPLVQFRGDATIASYYLIGIEQSRIPTISSGVYKTFDQFNPFVDVTDFRPDLNITREQFILWYQEGLEKLELEKSLKITEDPLLIFAEARPRSLVGRQKGLSPSHSIKALLNFLRDTKPTKEKSKALSRLQKDSEDRLTTILNSIDAVLDKDADPQIILKDIALAAMLNKSSNLFKNRIEFLVRLLIEEKVLSEFHKGTPEALRLLVAQDILKYLQDFSGSSSLQEILIDSKNSQQISLRSLKVFTEVFAEQIQRSLVNLDKNIIAFNENSLESPHRYAKTMICLSLLSTPAWDANLGLERCINSYIPSVFPKGLASPVFSKQLLSLPIDQRICQRRNFLLRNRALQSLLESGYEITYENSTSPTKVAAVKPSPQVQSEKLPLEQPVIDPDCMNAEAWKTEKNTYCEQDWWGNCDRKYARTCTPRPKRKSWF
ncbi:MAG: hypothetical protein ACOYOK_00300 [Pseudobdellovibrionaceae bacterium]